MSYVQRDGGRSAYVAGVWGVLLPLTMLTPPDTARAADVRLPLGGYCRPGRFFPVDVRGTAGRPVTVTGDGCVPTDAATDGVVPVLAVDPTGDLRWPGGGCPLRVPRADERLVGAVTPAAVPADLFPGSRPVTVRLDPADPLPGPPAAWETLDAVVLEPAMLRRLDDGQRSALLAGGVDLVAAGPARDRPPDDRWPWRRRGGRWTLSYAVRGPTDAVVTPDAFSPTYLWDPDWPAAVRRAAFAAGCLAAVAAVAACLVRRWWATWVAVGVAVLGGVGIGLWRLSLGTVTAAGGDVTAAGGGWVQRDAWVYERVRSRSSSASAAVGWGGWTHPAFESSAAMARAAPRLTVSADGRLAFAVSLGTAAFVHRNVRPGEPPVDRGGAASPMRDVARDLYLRVGDRLGGDVLPTAAGRWVGATVVVGR